MRDPVENLGCKIQDLASAVPSLSHSRDHQTDASRDVLAACSVQVPLRFVISKEPPRNSRSLVEPTQSPTHQQQQQESNRRFWFTFDSLPANFRGLTFWVVHALSKSRCCLLFGIQEP